MKTEKDRARNRQWYIDNKDRILKSHKEYYQKNKEILSEQHRLWHKNNPEHNERYYKKNCEKLKGKAKKYYKDNKEKCLEYKKQYHKNNLEKRKISNKKYRQNNPEKIRIKNNQYRIYKLRTDLKYNLNCKISRVISKSLKGNKNGKSWEILVGYNVNDLVKRLKETMPKNYSWKDFLDGKLHLEHKIPISVFNFTKPEHTDFERCWALENLRLLLAKENFEKSNKLTKPFQPALKI